MKKAMLATVVAIACILLSGCDGTHEDAVITCWAQPYTAGVTVVGSGVVVGSVTWYCTIQYENPSNGTVHNHSISGAYHTEHKSCKDKGGVLTADVTVSTSGSGRNERTNVNVGPRTCPTG